MSALPSMPMPDPQTFLLPARAYLLSMRDQNLPLRRAALDDAAAHFRETPPGGHAQLVALVALVDEALQILEDLAAWGDSFFSAPQGTAFSETHRVLRPGGRVALSVWGPPERNPWASIGGRFMVERGHLQPPEPGAPGPFSMASEERTHELLEGAGFTAVRIEEVAVQWRLGDLDEYRRWVMDVSASLALAIRGLSAEESEALTSHLAEGFAPFAADCGYELPGVALCAVAS